MASGESTFGTSSGACRVVRAGEAYQGRQGLTYLRGLTGETVGSKAICMTMLVLPDGARAKIHLHQGVETASKGALRRSSALGWKTMWTSWLATTPTFQRTSLIL